MIDLHSEARRIIRLLNLVAHPLEGGFFRETYRCPDSLSGRGLPPGTGSAAGGDIDTTERSLATAIYYLLAPGHFSALHRLRHDEIYHFYLGDPVEMLLLYADGNGETIRLGPDLAGGQRVQMVVSSGVWQGARLLAGGRFALLGTTMSPGFAADDFELADRRALVASFPDYAELISRLTW